MAPKSRKKRQNKGKEVKNIPIPFEEKPEDKNAPHSFVITRGVHSRNLVHICHDFRKIMEPYTAMNLKERRCNKIRDFVSLSGIFHVSYMCIFTQTERNLSLKIAKMQKGPTLTFKVHEYTLMKDVISSKKSQFVDSEAFLHSPLVVLNGFSGEGRHLKLMAATFQNMFPAINLTTVKLSHIRRCLMFSYSPITKLIELRHYFIKCSPVGINKGVKKLVNRQIPDLSKFEDVAEFVTKADYLSGSEAEDEDAKVIMPETCMGAGNLKDNKSAIKMYEIGPRFTLQLVKIEEGLMEGEVFFHEFVQKTEEEVDEIRKKREKRKKLKEQRKQKMKENVEAKKKAKDDAKKRSMGVKEEPMEQDEDEENYDELEIDENADIHQEQDVEEGSTSEDE